MADVGCGGGGGTGLTEPQLWAEALSVDPQKARVVHYSPGKCGSVC